MFLIKKIIVAFVLPPGCLVVALFALGHYLRGRCRPAALVCAGVAALTWAGSTRVFSDALMRPLEYKYSAPAKPAGDVIVVLGGGARDGDGVFSASERLAPGTLERVSAAYILHKKTRLSLLISGGTPYSSMSEAAAAAAYLVELGVPKAKIITEEASRDTVENAAFTRRICEAKGYKNIILVTSAYHMPRSMYLFKKAGFTSVTPFPIGRSSGGGHYLRDWLPGNPDTARALNEYLGLLYYRLKYSFS